MNSSLDFNSSISSSYFDAKKSLLALSSLFSLINLSTSSSLIFCYWIYWAIEPCCFVLEAASNSFTIYSLILKKLESLSSLFLFSLILLSLIFLEEFGGESYLIVSKSFI